MERGGNPESIRGTRHFIKCHGQDLSEALFLFPTVSRTAPALVTEFRLVGEAS